MAHMPRVRLVVEAILSLTSGFSKINEIGWEILGGIIERSLSNGSAPTEYLSTTKKWLRH